jgi:hypothetical protein
MFWKLKHEQTPTNLCPFIRNTFFYPAAAASLLFLAYRFFFNQMMSIWHNVIGDPAYRAIVWNIIVAAFGIVVLVAVLAGIFFGLKRIWQWLETKFSSRVTWENPPTSLVNQTVLENESDDRIPGTSLWGLILACAEMLHDKTCIPITVNNSNVSGGH